MHLVHLDFPGNTVLLVEILRNHIFGKNGNMQCHRLHFFGLLDRFLEELRANALPLEFLSNKNIVEISTVAAVDDLGVDPDVRESNDSTFLLHNKNGMLWI